MFPRIRLPAAVLLTVAAVAAPLLRGDDTPPPADGSDPASAVSVPEACWAVVSDLLAPPSDPTPTYTGTPVLPSPSGVAVCVNAACE